MMARDRLVHCQRQELKLFDVVQVTCLEYKI